MEFNSMPDAGCRMPDAENQFHQFVNESMKEQGNATRYNTAKRGGPVFKRHQDAEDAVRKLSSGGFDMTHFSIVGQGYHSEEKVMGFYNIGDRIKFWGKNGAFWGGIWGLFFGGIFLTIPMVGPVMVLGHLSAMVIAAVEGAAVVGGLSALGAALFSIGIPKDSVISYEEVLKTDGYLVVAHGSADEMARSKAIFESSNPARVDLHENVKNQVSAA